MTYVYVLEKCLDLPLLYGVYIYRYIVLCTYHLHSIKDDGRIAN